MPCGVQFVCFGEDGWSRRRIFLQRLVVLICVYLSSAWCTFWRGFGPCLLALVWDGDSCASFGTPIWSGRFLHGFEGSECEEGEHLIVEDDWWMLPIFTQCKADLPTENAQALVLASGPLFGLAASAILYAMVVSAWWSWATLRRIRAWKKLGLIQSYYFGDEHWKLYQTCSVVFGSLGLGYLAVVKPWRFCNGISAHMSRHAVKCICTVIAFCLFLNANRIICGLLPTGINYSLGFVGAWKESQLSGDGAEFWQTTGASTAVLFAMSWVACALNWLLLVRILFKFRATVKFHAEKSEASRTEGEIPGATISPRLTDGEPNSNTDIWL